MSPQGKCDGRLVATVVSSTSQHRRVKLRNVLWLNGWIPPQNGTDRGELTWHTRSASTRPAAPRS
ncbi:hypothetical protein RHCRD62_40634 [Rhodococcus sp. RD6.2]|nr:hypothetical protein RHCRD62_40634 [Rhodococcus sp. RD6.2]